MYNLDEYAVESNSGQIMLEVIQKKLANIGIKYNLFVSANINTAEIEEACKAQNIVIKRVSSITEDMFSIDNLSLFLVDAAFLKSSENAKNLKLYSNYKECVIQIVENQNECALIDEDIVLQYMFASVIDKMLLKAIKSGFKELVHNRQMLLLEKALVIAEDEIDELHTIASALSTEKKIDKLLKTILQRCINVTTSDAGSLYLVDTEFGTENKVLKFMLSQNFSLNIESPTFTLPMDEKSISGYVAVTKQILNIKDSYNIPLDAPYSHSKKFDEEYDYKTVSILTFPLINHKDEVIGVIQLVNKRTRADIVLEKQEDFEKYVLTFNDKDERYVRSLGSQAAVSLENALLYDNIQRLFEGFIKASVQAIESRDPTTSGHSERVAIYTVELAKEVGKTDRGKFQNIDFTQEQIKEIRYASLLHDFGKVGVREHVLVKAKKLYPGQIDHIEARFDVVKKDIFAKYQSAKLEYVIKNGGKGSAAESFLKEMDEKAEIEIKRLEHYFEELLRINEPKILSDNDFGLLDEIKSFKYQDIDGKFHNLIENDEVKKLSIPKGSLDDLERLEIESHVTHTFRFLSKIPWTNELKNIPDIAYGHHEKLNGSGYPRGLAENEIPLQSKIMTISDIYDALTSRDRPYKKAVTAEKALDILGFEAKDYHVDRELLDIFISTKCYVRANHLL
jgi:HD-GYP domain-containing protein (c-di-GMP phosphodiesterase class II)